MVCKASNGFKLPVHNFTWVPLGDSQFPQVSYTGTYQQHKAMRYG